MSAPRPLVVTLSLGVLWLVTGLALLLLVFMIGLTAVGTAFAAWEGLPFWILLLSPLHASWVAAPILIGGATGGLAIATLRRRRGAWIGNVAWHLVWVVLNAYSILGGNVAGLVFVPLSLVILGGFATPKVWNHFAPGENRAVPGRANATGEQP